MATEILTNSNTAQVAQEKWNDQCFQEYISEYKFKFLFGTDDNAIIKVMEDMKKGIGDAFTQRYVTSQRGGVVRGNATGAGNEGDMDFLAQRFVVNKVRSLHKIKDVTMTERRVSFSVKNEMKNALTEKHTETLEDDTIAMMCDATGGRVRGRYLYGAADSNWNATHATALQAIDATNDMLTIKMISAAKRSKAELIGTGVTSKIKPHKLMNGKKAERWYVGYFHPYSIRDLIENDAAFRNQFLMVPPGSNESVFFTGSDYKGNVDGVLIYSYDKMPLISSTIQVSHNLIMGARAGILAWGQRSKFTDDTVPSAANDYGHDYGAELCDIRNERVIGTSNNMKCINPEGTAHDYGLVNLFCSAVAD